jgi:type II secretory pathway component GspD/PulD (secretin)
MSLNNEAAVLRSDDVTVSITPQIGADGMVTLSFAPIVKAGRTAESDTLARVADGETLVVSGFGRDRQVKERQAAGVRGGGWFGRRTVETRKRVELVILVTPRIL